MKQILYSLLIALTFTTNIVPLTVNSTLLANKDTGKRVLLLGDAHDQGLLSIIESQPTQKAVAKATLSTLNTARLQQKKALTTFTHAMLADDNKKSAQTVVISEAYHRDLRDLCNNKPCNTLKSETFYVIPQIFMNTLLGSESNTEERCDIFEKSITPFGTTTKNSFAFSNQLRWVAGDTFRDTNQDMLLHHIKSQTVEDLVTYKASLPAHVAEISIGDVKNDVLESRSLFAKCDVDDLDSEKALALIDAELKAGNVTESTPIIDLTIQLRENDPVKAKVLHSHLNKLSANKFNLELFLYFRVFEDDAALKYLVINAGLEHTDFVKTKLIKNGFEVVEMQGSNALSTNEFQKADPEKTLVMLSKTLNHLKRQSPLARLPQLFKA